MLKTAKNKRLDFAIKTFIPARLKYGYRSCFMLTIYTVSE